MNGRGNDKGKMSGKNIVFLDCVFYLFFCLLLVYLFSDYILILHLPSVYISNGSNCHNYKKNVIS